jgi:PAS domain S-box-containing protein
MKRQKKKTGKRQRYFSTLSLYIMASGWVGLAVYVFLFFFVLDVDDGNSFLKHFLSTEQDGMKFRALVFFTPFISTVIGFLVNEREKFYQRSLGSKARYHDLFEHANDAILLLGVDTTIIEANEKTIALLGYAREELLGRRLCDLAPEQGSVLLDGQAEEERFVCQIHTGSGDVLDMELTTSRIEEDGQTTGYRIIARDITDFKKMQEELSRAYDELQTCYINRTGELSDARKRLLFESYELHKAEETIGELLMRKKFGEQALPDIPDLSDEEND